MRSYFLKAAGFAVALFALHTTGFAQDEERDTLNKKPDNNAEIVIRSKSDKDLKLDVEIKDGKVFIDGKPIEEFKSDDVSVRKLRRMVEDGRNLAFDFSTDGMGARHDGSLWSIDVQRPLLGVISDKEESTDGAKIKEVTKGSAAEKAGLKTGDLITKIDDTKISNASDLVNAIRAHKPDETVTITFKRDNNEQQVKVVLGKSKEIYNYNYNLTVPDLNFTVPPIPPIPPHVFIFGNERPKLGIKAQDTEDGKGVKVLDVDDDSPAEKAGIEEGDIITRFDGKDVNSATELADMAKDLSDKTTVKIDLTRDGKSKHVEVKVPKKLNTADL